MDYTQEEYDRACKKVKQDRKLYIENYFMYHSPKGNQPERYEAIREQAKQLANYINDACPECNDKDEAIKKLRQAVMFANASIAINE